MVGVGFYTRWLLSTDAFARFRADRSPLAGDIGMRLEDVAIKSYRMGKLVVQFHVDRMDVRKDRNHFMLSGVSKGRYFAKDGAVQFSCGEGEYDQGMRRFQGRQGARVWNADLDLSVDNFDYLEDGSRLVVPGRLAGKMFDGAVEADRLEYFSETGFYSTGPIMWTGDILMQGQEGAKSGEGQKVKWTVKGVSSAKRRGDIEEYENVHATDGEVIVKAPHVEINRKTDVLVATGRVNYYGLDANVLCDKVTVFRKEKRAILEGRVTMIAKPEEEQKLEEVEIPPYTPTVPDEIAKNRPKPSDTPTEAERKQDEEIRSTENFRKYPAVMAAERIEYWYAKGNRHAVITGKPEAFQAIPDGGWRRAWAPTAYYDGEKEKLKMVSTEGKKDTHFMTSVGDDLFWTWIELSTKKGEENNWEGYGPEGDVVVNEEEGRNRKGTKNPPPDKTKPPLQGPIGGGKKG